MAGTFVFERLKDADVIAQIEKAQALVENLGAQEAAKFLTEEERKWSEVAQLARIVHRAATNTKLLAFE